MRAFLVLAAVVALCGWFKVSEGFSLSMVGIASEEDSNYEDYYDNDDSQSDQLPSTTAEPSEGWITEYDSDDFSYLEIIFVYDHEAYIDLGADMYKVHKHARNTETQVNALLAPLNVSVILVDVVVWSEKDAFDVVENRNTVRERFNGYKNDVLDKKTHSDYAHLFSGRKNHDDIILHYTDGICTYYSGGISMGQTDVTTSSKAAVHWIGLKLGLRYDYSFDPNCNCNGSPCLMSRRDFGEATLWSKCSIDQWYTQRRQSPVLACIRDKPEKVWNSHEKENLDKSVELTDDISTVGKQPPAISLSDKMVDQELKLDSKVQQVLTAAKSMEMELVATHEAMEKIVEDELNQFTSSILTKMTKEHETPRKSTLSMFGIEIDYYYGLVILAVVLMAVLGLVIAIVQLKSRLSGGETEFKILKNPENKTRS